MVDCHPRRNIVERGGGGNVIFILLYRMSHFQHFYCRMTLSCEIQSLHLAAWPMKSLEINKSIILTNPVIQFSLQMHFFDYYACLLKTYWFTIISLDACHIYWSTFSQSHFHCTFLEFFRDRTSGQKSQYHVHKRKLGWDAAKVYFIDYKKKNRNRQINFLLIKIRGADWDSFIFVM